MYKLRNNNTYTESLNTLNDREDQNYEENEGSTKPTGVYLRKMEKEYMKEAERSEREPPGTTAPIVIKQYTLLIW